jgi:UDP-2-acetamido-3-amino-2,3-dideoxy-glucuronate N-acetyltransferase
VSNFGNLKVAVLGGGYWGKNLVRNFFELGVLKWVCDIDPNTLTDLRNKYSGVLTTTNYQEVLDDGEVSAVVIASPAAMHYDHSTRAMNHGKDIFVEKPLALNLTQGRQITAMAEAKELVLMVGHILEYHPGVKRLKSIASSGELGEIRYVYSNRLNLGKVRQEESILWSFAPHDISIISGLMGVPLETVSASAGCYLQKHIADVTVTNLSYAGGARSHIFVSWLHPYKEMKLVVIGDRKMAVFNDAIPEGKLMIYDKGIEWEADRPIPRQDSETSVVLEDKEPMREECIHFLECVSSRAMPLTGGDNALNVLQVLQACELSIDRGGAPVSLREVLQS